SYQSPSRLRVNATQVLQSGALGVGRGGHVGHVEKVYGSHWFVIGEMNCCWYGGGFVSVDSRCINTGTVVSSSYHILHCRRLTAGRVQTFGAAMPRGARTLAKHEHIPSGWCSRTTRTHLPRA